MASNGTEGIWVKCRTFSIFFVIVFLAIASVCYLAEVQVYLHNYSILSGQSPQVTPSAIVKYWPSSLMKQGSRIAICLVGGARSFELTGPSIMEHLLSAYPESDIFLNLPVDENSQKVSLLANVKNLASVRIFAQEYITESGVPRAVLNPKYSPQAVQGLLQYFELVEGCSRLIRNYEKQHGFQYKWILRSRVDGYWQKPPPPLKELLRNQLTIPYGSNYYGLNDRLAVGLRDPSQEALHRRSILPELKQRGKKLLTSESSFRFHMRIKNVDVGRADFHFCVLTHRQYAWPLRYDGVPVAALGSKGPLNGAKCRPCTPAMRGAQATEALKVLYKNGGGLRSGVLVDLCDARKPWPRNWKAIFDKVAGPKAAAIRKSLEKQTISACIAENTRFQAVVEHYVGPPAVILCLHAHLGAPMLVGTGPYEWPVFLKALSKKSVIYSFGVGYNLSLEAALTKFDVHVFDSTPHGVSQVAKMNLPFAKKMKLHDWCINSGDEDLVVNPLAWPGNAPGLWTSLTVPPDGYVFPDKARKVAAKTLSTTMKLLGHTRLDLLKLSMSGTEFALILAWDEAQVELPVCQLLVQFGVKWAGDRGEFLRHKSLEALSRLGFTRVKCLGAPGEQRCTFLSQKHCR